MRHRLAISVGAVVVFGDCVLMLQRAYSDDILPGFWEIPGGGREPFEDIIVASRREIHEETGLEVDILCPLSPFCYTVPDGAAKELRDTVQINHLVVALNPTALVLSPEHIEYAWVPWDQIDCYEVSIETYRVLVEAEASGSAFIKREKEA